MPSKELLVEISKGVLIAIIFVSLTLTVTPVKAAQDDNDQIDDYEIGGMYIKHYEYYNDIWLAPNVVTGFIDTLSDNYLGYQAFLIHDDDILNTYWYDSDNYPSNQYPHIDSVDIFVFIGHGDKYMVDLWNYTEEDPDPTPVSGNMVDFSQLLLHTDLEWAFIISCETLNVTNQTINNLRLSIIGEGLHSFFGMHSPLYATSDFGEYLADKLSVWSISNWQAWKSTVHEKSEDNADEAALVFAYVLRLSYGSPISYPTPEDILSGRIGPNFGGYIVVDYRNEDLVEPYIDPIDYNNAIVYAYLYWQDVI